MVHSIKVIRKEQQAINKWAGGTTTQLAIYPEDASYIERSFIWRLSTAVVELEESTFTKLPSFDRKLMVLEGELKLVHEKQHSIILKQFEQDSFNGGWDTKSFGKARDFNLMLKEGLTGSLKHYRLISAKSIKEQYAVSEDYEGFYTYYCYNGAAEIIIEKQTVLLNEGELLVVHYGGIVKTIVKGINDTVSDIIIAQICI